MNGLIVILDDLIVNDNPNTKWVTFCGTPCIRITHGRQHTTENTLKCGALMLPISVSTSTQLETELALFPRNAATQPPKHKLYKLSEV